jgi:hypothetical protein
METASHFEELCGKMRKEAGAIYSDVTSLEGLRETTNVRVTGSKELPSTW